MRETASAPDVARPPREGLFGPGSVTWKVDREVAVLLGSGSRALLMQVAHPKVAAAVAEHSRYRSDTLGRLRDTLDAIYGFAFEDTAHVERASGGYPRRQPSACNCSQCGCCPPH